MRLYKSHKCGILSLFYHEQKEDVQFFQYTPIIFILNKIWFLFFPTKLFKQSYNYSAILSKAALKLKPETAFFLQLYL